MIVSTRRTVIQQSLMSEMNCLIPATLLFCANLAATNLPLAVYMETGTSVYISFPFIMLMDRSLNSVYQNIRTVLRKIIDLKV